MSSERDKMIENPYESPQIGPDSCVDPPPLEKHWAWAFAANVTLLATTALYVTMEFGMSGFAMLLGGFAGSYFGWWLSKRWWGLAIGAIAGFTCGAAFGIVLLFVFASRGYVQKPFYTTEIQVMVASQHDKSKP